MTATTRHVFHLAFPVRDLAQARAFYVERLGARVGREGDAWLDILLWGHQITLHERPDEVLPREQAKLHLEDPSHHVLEIKAYRDADGTLHAP